jgi:excisionase family DNA binding protein
MGQENAEDDDEFLSLSAAARALGVHPGTVRQWSDQGRIPVYRTQGGHRRYRASEIRLWKQTLAELDAPGAERIVQLVMANVRQLIGESQLAAEPWYQKMQPGDREQYRSIGRALSEGLAWYLTSDPAHGEAAPRAIGQDYALRSLRAGMSRVEAAQGFLFFRGVLLDALLGACADAHAVSSCVFAEMLRKTADFIDRVLMAFLERYEEPLGDS